MILGRYAPDTLAITTPNYTFNHLFTSPTATPSQIREGGHLDPTGRTNRVFRHSDHKFEWTESEFESWCNENAVKWGYSVTTGGIGQNVEHDPWNRDAKDLFASQTAVFRRLEPERKLHRDHYATSARTVIESYLSLNRDESNLTINQPEIFTHYQYLAHKTAKVPLAPAEILSQLQTILNDVVQAEESNVSEIWNYDEIAVACGGRLECLYEAIEADTEEWEWVDQSSYSTWARRFRWKRFKAKDLVRWEEEAVEVETASDTSDSPTYSHTEYNSIENSQASWYTDSSTSSNIQSWYSS